ncbi:MAG: DsbE family thiol:disulfide interchange protein, partial [Marinobacter sp.]
MKRLLLFTPLILAVVLGVVLFAGIGKDPNKLES